MLCTARTPLEIASLLLRRYVLLHEATAGATRDLDRLATSALRETARKKRKLVERDVVARVIEADVGTFGYAPDVVRAIEGSWSRGELIAALARV